MLGKILFVLTVFFAFCSDVCPYNIQSHEITSLQEGKVLLKPVVKNSVKGSQSAILINAPREKIWNLLENKENFPKLIKQIKETTVLRDDGINQTVKTSVKVCRVLPNFDYIICFDNSEELKKMSFKKTEGCFKELFGSFELIPYGRATILDCRIYADPGFCLPVFIGRSLKSDFEDIMRTIKNEAEK